MKKWKIRLHVVFQELFQYSLLTYLILLVIETLQQGFVDSIFNTNLLLGVVVVSGTLLVISHSEKQLPKEPHKKLTGADVQNDIIFSVLGALLVYYKTQDLGTVAYIIAGMTGIIILLVSILLFLNEE